MTVERGAFLRRRIRRRLAGMEVAGTPARRITPRQLLLVLAAIVGGGAIIGVGFALITYLTAISNVVPPDQLLARYSRGGARIYDRHGELMYEFVDELSGLRRPVKLDEISPWVTQATIAVEDPDFEKNEIGRAHV